MNDIKLRAWDESNHEYVYSFNFNDYEISDEDGVIYISKSHEQSGSTPCLLLEQYTGMKDKKGEEIYEGDEVLTELYYTTDGESYTLPHSGIVTYDKDHGTYATDNEAGLTAFYQHHGDRLIIGNIHDK